MKVSVIVPNYNHAPYLRERLDSVLAQTYQDFEVIVLDDCSTDNSRTIIESYRDVPHVSQIIFNEQNSGSTFVQWERGIEAAQGEFIWIAESDDVADSRFLEVLMAELAQHPDANIAFSQSRLIDSQGEDLHIEWHRPMKEHACAYDGRWFALHRMLKNNYIYNASMAVFRKESYMRISRDFRRFRYCGDYLFWMDMSLSGGSVIEVSEHLNSFRQHTAKVTVEAEQSGKGGLEAAEIMNLFVNRLQLKGFQLHCLRGRTVKRWGRMGKDHELVRKFPRVFGGNLFDVICYELGKLTGFLA
jgi:glycosyltransferase involved in cell wall biosynthesis